MNTETLNIFPTIFRAALSGQYCPKYSAQMTEVDRHNENGALFVWYECRGDGCDGQ